MAVDLSDLKQYSIFPGQVCISFLVIQGSGCGRVVKLLAYGARGLGRFELPSPHLNFRDWASPASELRYD